MLCRRKRVSLGKVERQKLSGLRETPTRANQEKQSWHSVKYWLFFLCIKTLHNSLIRWKCFSTVNFHKIHFQVAPMVPRVYVHHHAPGLVYGAAARCWYAGKNRTFDVTGHIKTAGLPWANVKTWSKDEKLQLPLPCTKKEATIFFWNMENGVWILEILHRIWPENSLSLRWPPFICPLWDPHLWLCSRMAPSNRKKNAYALDIHRWSQIEHLGVYWNPVPFPGCFHHVGKVRHESSDKFCSCADEHVLTLTFASGAAMIRNVRFKPNWACKGQALQSHLQKSNLIQSDSYNSEHRNETLQDSMKIWVYRKCSMISLNLSRLQTCCRISRGGGFLGSKNLRDSVMTRLIAIQIFRDFQIKKQHTMELINLIIFFEIKNIYVFKIHNPMEFDFCGAPAFLEQEHDYDCDSSLRRQKQIPRDHVSQTSRKNWA